MTPPSIPLSEYHQRLKAQGLPADQALVKCPMCGTLQSGADLVAAGAGPDLDSISLYYGFSCIGRWTHGKGPPKVKGTQVGCNWTLGGLLQICDLYILDDAGKKHPAFEPATPEEAQAHLTAKSLP